MNVNGIVLGALSFLIIGIWHPIVIKGEYYLGKKACIWIFSLVGALSVVGSLLIDHDTVSTVLALFGFSAFWGIGEAIHQEKRVAKGWFPANPKRKK